MKNRRCLNLACPLRGKVSSGNIVRHGFYRTRSGKRRRYRCGECGKTFSSTKGTPYYRLQHRRATFDGVIALRVEGVSISAISRIKGIAWNTVARWLEKAAQVCRRFNHRRIAGFAAEELQADEIRTFAGNKKTPSWVFVTIEVWSRLWPSTVTGRRSYRNTHALFRDLSRRMNFERLPLIVTDGFEFYQKVIRRFFGPACLYGQVLKTRRNDRIIKVERRALHGAAWRFEDALNNSEDSSTLNTSFIDLTTRRLTFDGEADEHLELLRCYYNFVRPHGALKFGREIRTPAMQAGLTTRRLTFRDIFLATTIPLWSRIEVFLLTGARNPVSSAPVPLPAAA